MSRKAPTRITVLLFHSKTGGHVREEYKHFATIVRWRQLGKWNFQRRMRVLRIFGEPVSRIANSRLFGEDIFIWKKWCQRGDDRLRKDFERTCAKNDSTFNYEASEFFRNRLSIINLLAGGRNCNLYGTKRRMQRRRKRIILFQVLFQTWRLWDWSWVLKMKSWAQSGNCKKNWVKRCQRERGKRRGKLILNDINLLVYNKIQSAIFDINGYSKKEYLTLEIRNGRSYRLKQNNCLPANV